jgi:hypothetical protein
MTGRARRATRRLRANFGTRLGTVPTSTAGEDAAGNFAARLALRSPANRGRAWEHARSRAGTPTGPTGTAGERRARWKAAQTRATLWHAAAGGQLHSAVPPQLATRSWTSARRGNSSE